MLSFACHATGIPLPLFQIRIIFCSLHTVRNSIIWVQIQHLFSNKKVTLAILYYYHYFCLTAILPGEPVPAGPPSRPHPPPVLEQPLGTSEMGFYGLDIVSKHWRKCKILALTSGQASSLLHPSPNSWWKGCCSLYAGSLTPVPCWQWYHTINTTYYYWKSKANIMGATPNPSTVHWLMKKG